MLIFLMFGFLSINQAFAEDGVTSAQNGLNKAATRGFDGKEGSKPTSIMTDIPTAIGKIIGAGLAFIGVLFFLLMIYGGFTWMIARGNETEVTKAKELIQAAVIGLVIVLAAYTVTSFISSNLTNPKK